MTNEQILRILQAAKLGHIETVETRGMDDLDFHELSVESIKRLVQTAYSVGMAQGAESAARGILGK